MRAGTKKRYPIKQSRLFRLNSKRRLAELLKIDLPTLMTLAAGDANYRVFQLRQENGKVRTIEEPKPQLKRVHARLADLLSRIEPPPYLHSGTKGRSYLTNAAAHLDNGHVIKTDLSKFYPSTTHRHVFVGLIREFKCSGDVADLIAQLCTYEDHVPTGSPVSMVIAFYSHKQIFEQLYRRMAAKGVKMTVYVDDLTFSGEQVMRVHLCAVKKAFQNVGLTCHKTSCFSAHTPKVVTGAILTEDGLRLPNRRHLRIRRGINRLASAASEVELKKTYSRLIGQLNEAAAVEERFRVRLPGFKLLIERIALRAEQRLRELNDRGF